jgi:hypothetical protein
MRLRPLIVSLCLLLAIAAIPATAEAQIQSRGMGSRYWVDVNVGPNFSVASETTFSFDYGQEWPGNPAHTMISATYGRPSSGFLFDIGGGYMFTPRFGVGASWNRYSMDDPATLNALIPDFDPDFPAGFGSSTSNSLTRTESQFNISAMFCISHNDRMEFRAYAGPSYFTYDATMIFDIAWSQVFNATGSDVTIVDYATREATGNGWGFHAGADFAWMFTKNVGVGGGVRWAQGKATVDKEPMSEVSQDITVGGVQVLFGGRFRFGSR